MPESYISAPVKPAPNGLLKFYYQYTLGFRMENQGVYNKYCIIKQALGDEGAKKAAHKYLNGSTLFTLEVCDNVVSDKDNAKAFDRLNPLEKLWINFNPLP